MTHVNACLTLSNEHMHDIIFSWIKISETFSSITFSFELVDATFDGSKENPTSFFFLIFIYLFFNEKYG